MIDLSKFQQTVSILKSESIDFFSLYPEDINSLNRSASGSLECQRSLEVNQLAVYNRTYFVFNQSHIDAFPAKNRVIIQTYKARTIPFT